MLAFKSILQAVENPRKLFFFIDHKLELPPLTRLRLKIEADAKRLFKKLRQPRGKIAALGDDANFLRAEGIAIQKHPVALCQRA